MAEGTKVCVKAAYAVFVDDNLLYLNCEVVFSMCVCGLAPENDPVVSINSRKELYGNYAISMHICIIELILLQGGTF